MKLSVYILSLAAACLPAVGFGATPDFYAGFDTLPPSVFVYHYKLSQSVMQAQLAAAMQKAMNEGLAEKKQAEAQGKHATVTAVANLFVLPQLYIYDPQGQEIVSHTGVQKNLNAVLDQAFYHHPKAVPGNNPLGALLDGAVPVHSSDTAPYEPDRYTLVEYWATWCESCFVERDTLMAYVRKHPHLHLDWITVDADYGALKKQAGKPAS